MDWHIQYGVEGRLLDVLHARPATQGRYWIYCIFEEGTCLYIGQTYGSVKDRLTQHFTNQSDWFLYCLFKSAFSENADAFRLICFQIGTALPQNREQALIAAERYYIQTHVPTWNQIRYRTAKTTPPTATCVMESVPLFRGDFAFYVLPRDVSPPVEDDEDAMSRLIARARSDMQAIRDDPDFAAKQRAAAQDRMEQERANRRPSSRTPEESLAIIEREKQRKKR